MSQGLFVTGTGTDVGKTYVTALLVKALRDAGFDTGYYKAAISGAPSVAESDAGYVNRVAGIGQEEETLLSYLYDNAVSPHLAAQIEGNPVEESVIREHYARVAAKYPYVVMEGSGGIMCPIRYDETARIFLEDIIQWFSLPTLLVADAGLGTINSVVLTVEYLKHRNIPIQGILLNNYTGGVMQEDNEKMIVDLTGVPVLGRVRPGDTRLEIDKDVLAALFA